MRLQLSTSGTVRRLANRCVIALLAAGAIAGTSSAGTEQAAMGASYAVAMTLDVNGEQSTPRVLTKAGEKFAVASGVWRVEMTARPARTSGDVGLAGKLLKGADVVSVPTLLVHLNEQATIKVSDGSNPVTLSMTVSRGKAETKNSSVSISYDIALQDEYAVE